MLRAVEMGMGRNPLQQANIWQHRFLTTNNLLKNKLFALRYREGYFL